MTNFRLSNFINIPFNRKCKKTYRIGIQNTGKEKVERENKNK